MNVSTYPALRELVTNRSYLLLVIAGGCIGGGFYTTTRYTVLYVDESVGGAVAAGGAVLAVMQVTESVGKVVAGRLADAAPGSTGATTGSILSLRTFGGVLFFAVTLVETPIEAVIVFAGLGLFELGSTGLYYSCISAIVADEDIGPPPPSDSSRLPWGVSSARPRSDIWPTRSATTLAGLFSARSR